MSGIIKPERILPNQEEIINGSPQKETDVNGVKKSEGFQIVWFNVFKFSLLHLFALIGFAQMVILGQVKGQTILWAVLFYFMSTIGAGVGSHRFWSHRSFKAKLPLRILLIIFQTISVQNSAYEWARDHRLHHLKSETSSDPHNAKNGFFFAHIGWLCVKKLPEVKEQGKKIDLSDLEKDSVVMFQRRYYLPMAITLCFLIPIIIPCLFWDESPVISFFSTSLRYVLSLHAIWLINSVAHLYGNKPYDNSINPSESKLVSIINFGEGWHNYHHTFPYDYKAGELGIYRYNISALFIDICAKLGLAYDLKTVPQSTVYSRVKRCGDGTHDIMKSFVNKMD